MYTLCLLYFGFQNKHNLVIKLINYNIYPTPNIKNFIFLSM